MTKQESIQRLLNPGVIAVIRTSSSESLPDVCTALADGGVTCMEITMTTPNALETIREITSTPGARIHMGVGSVTDANTARMALYAGAEFVVTPVMKAEIIQCCNQYGKPIVCGCYSPTEALTACELGADFIKIFPADGLGPDYIKALKAPMPQLQIIPTGGVTVTSCPDFIKAGSAAVAAGSSLLRKEMVEKKDWPGLSDQAARFVAAVKTARNQLK